MKRRSTHAIEVVTTWLRLSKSLMESLARFRHHGHTKMQAVCILACCDEPALTKGNVFLTPLLGELHQLEA